MKIKILFCFMLLCLMPLCGCTHKEIAVEAEPEISEYRFDNAFMLSIYDISIKTNNLETGPSVMLLNDSLEPRIIVKAPKTLLNDLKVNVSNGLIAISAIKNNVYLTKTCEISIYNAQFNNIKLSGGIKLESCDEAITNESLALNLSGACIFNVNKFNLKSLAATLSGASKISCSSSIINNLKVVASGASEINLKASKITDFILRISGASFLTLSGEVEKLDFSLSGAAVAKLENAITNYATVSLSGSAFLKINFIENLKGTISGASTVKYIGDTGKVDIKTSGAANLERID